jgi:hypothetical protein
MNDYQKLLAIIERNPLDSLHAIAAVYRTIASQPDVLPEMATKWAIASVALQNLYQAVVFYSAEKPNVR